MTGQGGADQAANAPDYNPIFEKLVDGNDDQRNELIGIVAYALYKKAKREWAMDLWNRTGRKPTEEQLAELNCPPFRPDTRREQRGSRISLRTGLCRRTISVSR